VAIFIAQLALPQMKAAKPASQIKRFVHLFGAHASENTPGFFFRHCLSVLHVDYASPTGLLLSGSGTAIITGPGLAFLNTTGTWNLSAQTLNLATFTFSSTTSVPNGVPDGGTTATLLGGSLFGLAFIGRKQKLNQSRSV